MEYPKLTIIIPTLQRPETLQSTIKTALNQQYPNYSIIVSDNFSNDNTKEIVTSFNSAKITYINPGCRLSMSKHWEFALTHVEEGYVTILGDDDGVLPGALQKVANILHQYPLPVIGWRFCNFNWKGLSPHFSIPLANYFRIVDAAKEINTIFAQSIYASIEFPSLYGGFISIDLINKLKQENGGIFFHSRIPDFFSGALVAASVKKYIRLDFPITINATSKYSTGFAVVNKDHKQSAFTNLQKGDDNIPFHKNLLFIRSIVVPISEALMRVHELQPEFPQVDIKKMLTAVAAEASAVNSADEFTALQGGIEAIAALNNLKEYGNELIKSMVHRPAQQKVKKKFSPVSLLLYVDTTNTNIDTVEDACNFANNVIFKKYSRLIIPGAKNYYRIKATLLYFYLKFLSPQKKYF